VLANSEIHITDDLLAEKCLTRNALRKIVESAKGSRDEYFLLQVIENRKKEGNSNIKQRLTLSDGTSCLITMITDKFDKIEVST
jgi:hypothetical protein